MSSDIIVLKFGSSVLRSIADLPTIVHEIYRWYRDGSQIIAVVSAIGNTTETLLRQAEEQTSQPEPWATAELLATGERTSAALLGIALDRAGVPARVVNPREIELTVEGSPLDGSITRVNVAHILELLAGTPVLVVPGFFGTDIKGRTQLLGRGGSDLTAVFLAVAVSARCRLLKDMDGVYESDPKYAPVNPRRFEILSYEKALKVARQLIQPKAVAYLRENNFACEVAKLQSVHATLIYGGETKVAPTPGMPDVPMEVVLLGCGTVGLGIYQRLAAYPDTFVARGVLVRDRARHEAAGIPAEILHTKLETMHDVTPGIVIDALPGTSPSFEIIAYFLSRGIHVVTANKAVIAANGAQLHRLAKRCRAQLLYSAAVGGATPMLECVTRNAGRIGSLEAILNGTCNFVLDACAAGASLSEAVAAAQRFGFAEVDPSDDLSGGDAARKLQIVARAAFGVEVRVACQPLDESVAASARAIASSSSRLRQIARVRTVNGHLTASVTFERIAAHSALFDVAGEWNALTLSFSESEAAAVRGRGAGRWPTAEAVVADAFEIVRLA